MIAHGHDTSGTGEPRIIIMVQGFPPTGEPDVIELTTCTLVYNCQVQTVEKIDWDKMLKAMEAMDWEPEPKPYSTKIRRERVPKRPRPKNIKPRFAIRAGQYRLCR